MYIFAAKRNFLLQCLPTHCMHLLNKKKVYQGFIYLPNMYIKSVRSNIYNSKCEVCVWAENFQTTR